jgi:hypothetical protein
VTALLGGLLAAFTLTGCAGPETPTGTKADRQTSTVTRPDDPDSTRQRSDRAGHAHARHARTTRLPAPRIVHARGRLQCVPFARRHVNISLRGHAWTWWRAAKGRYERGRRPQVGSVLVLKRRGRSLGHIAVVTRIVGPREIIADHANWLNRGRIHLGTPVRDVSKNNDWSAVRIWYTPGNTLGRSTYPAYGFIYPRATDS